MSAEPLDFSVDTTGIDRASLLAECAGRLDALASPLSDGALGAAPSAEGELLRALIDDQASFGGFPEVHRISEQSFVAQKITAPVKFRELAKSFNFYWIYFPVVLFPRRNWAFDRLELAVALTGADRAAHLQPRVIQVLPNQKFQELINAHSGLEVRLDEQFNLNVAPLSLNTPVGGAQAGVTAKAAGQLGLTVGPFTYQIKRARIQHSGTGAERVFWRIDGAEFFQEDSPDLIVIAQVPKGQSGMQAEARLQAYRSFNFASSGLQQAIAELPRVLREYFAGGAPLPDSAIYDLTPRL